MAVLDFWQKMFFFVNNYKEIIFLLKQFFIYNFSITNFKILTFLLISRFLTNINFGVYI